MCERVPLTRGDSVKYLDIKTFGITISVTTNFKPKKQGTATETDALPCQGAMQNLKLENRPMWQAA